MARVFGKDIAEIHMNTFDAMNKPLTIEELARKSEKKTTRQNKSFTTVARRFIEKGGWRYEMYKVLYRSKAFSTVLILLILLSTSAIILQTVPEFDLKARQLFAFIEWFVTILFTIEYLLRVIATPRPTRYIFSTIGFIDFISVFPTYLTLFLLSTTNYLAVVRLVRLFRLFRAFDSKEYSKYTREAGYLMLALKNSQRKISIFILIVMISVTIIGSLMYVIERNGNTGFNSIPRSIYWAIVTLTTVGYGDIAPQTSLGQTLASFLMLMGFSTIVVFTSIVGAEVYRQRDEKRSISKTKSCLECGMTGHEEVASYCKYCGGRLWG